MAYQLYIMVASRYLACSAQCHYQVIHTAIYHILTPFSQCRYFVRGLSGPRLEMLLCTSAFFFIGRDFDWSRIYFIRGAQRDW